MTRMSSITTGMSSITTVKYSSFDTETNSVNLFITFNAVYFSFSPPIRRNLSHPVQPDLFLLGEGD